MTSLSNTRRPPSAAFSQVTRSRIFPLLLSLLAAPHIASAQKAPAAPQQTPATTQAPNAPTTPNATTTVQVNVKVVSVPVTVRDKHGAIIANLTKDDFTLAEDNRPQVINYFTHDTSLPLSLGLLVDTSMSQRSVLDEERTASQHFLDQMLTDPKDKAFLIQFEREVDLLEDLSSDKGKMRAAIDQLGAPQFGHPRSGDDDGQTSGRDASGHHYGAGTLLYDSIYLASEEVLKKQPGRKALILLTDGVDRGSKETINSAIESAQRADTAIYAIYFKGEESHNNNGGSPSNGGRHGGGYPGGGYPGGGGGYPGGGGGGGYPGGGRGGQRPQQESHVDGKKILEKICGETGGRMFEASKKETADQIYTTIAEELRSQYMLGYTPDKQSTDSGFHRITLTAKKKELFVQAREGYYADR